MTKTPPHQRHFPYKHPTFGTKSHPKLKSAWENTIYYWWWAYLKRNKDYLECCQNGGAGSLAVLYEDFGDIRGDDFKVWWFENKRGERLFAEPRAEDSIRILEEGEKALNTVEALTVTFPLNLPKKFIFNRLKRFLIEYHKGQRGYQYAKKSQSKYKFQGQPNVPALKQALMVYDAIRSTKDLGLKKAYWEIANELRLVEKGRRVLSTDPQGVVVAKKNILTAIIGRYKKRVEKSIENTSKGIFP